MPKFYDYGRGGGGGGLTPWMLRQRELHGPRDHGSMGGEDDDEIGACIDNGMALGATDEGTALEMGREYRFRMRRGESRDEATVNTRRSFARRAAAWAQRQGWTPPSSGGGGRRWRLQSPIARVGEDDNWSVGGDDDELGGIDEADEMELGAIEEEIGELAGDDDDDGVDEMGGLQSMNNRIEKLQALQAKLEAKLAATPPNKLRKRKRILAHLSRVKKNLDKKTAKFGKRADKVAAKLGVPVAALVGGTAGAAAAGITAAAISRADRDLDRGAAMRAEGFGSFWGPRQAPDGIEVPVPFEDDGEPFLFLTKPIGVAGSVASVTMETDSISYADFELLGLDIAAQITMSVATDIPPVVIVTAWGISGGLSQLYRPMTVTQLGGQVGQSGAGLLMISKSFPAIRQDKIPLGRTNTASITMDFNSPKDNTGRIDVIITANLKLRITKDDNIPRYK